jgi:hypothetical protein
VNKLSKIVTGVLMALGLLLGGLVASVPAQAQPDVATAVSQPATLSGEVGPLVAGSTVRYTGCEGDGCGKQIYMTNTSGARRSIFMGQYMTNVFRMCPYSIGQKLYVKTPGGTWIRLAYGECYSPGWSGNWVVNQQG